LLELVNLRFYGGQLLLIFLFVFGLLHQTLYDLELLLNYRREPKNFMDDWEQWLLCRLTQSHMQGS
jgi:hypothetical protein